MLGLIADALMAFVYYNLMETYAVMTDTWASASGSFNEGQNVIMYTYLWETILNWLEGAAEAWPYAEIGEYVSDMWNAYDTEVMERAFSGTIDEPVPEIEGLINASTGPYELAQFLYAVDDFMGAITGKPLRGGRGGGFDLDFL